MEIRGRDLLRAEARLLGDYCGEDAVRRWREALSAEERERVVSAPGSLEGQFRPFVGAVRRILRAVLDAMTSLLRPLFDTLVATYAMISGRTIESFGRQMP